MHIENVYFNQQGRYKLQTSDVSIIHCFSMRTCFNQDDGYVYRFCCPASRGALLRFVCLPSSMSCLLQQS